MHNSCILFFAAGFVLSSLDFLPDSVLNISKLSVRGKEMAVIRDAWLNNMDHANLPKYGARLYMEDKETMVVMVRSLD